VAGEPRSRPGGLGWKSQVMLSRTDERQVVQDHAGVEGRVGTLACRWIVPTPFARDQRKGNDSAGTFIMRRSHFQQRHFREDVVKVLRPRLALDKAPDRLAHLVWARGAGGAQIDQLPDVFPAGGTSVVLSEHFGVENNDLVDGIDSEPPREETELVCHDVGYCV